MITVKAFVTKASYYNNHANQTSKYFELTTQSRTYARDVQETTLPVTDADLVIFRATNGINTDLKILNEGPSAALLKDIDLAVKAVLDVASNTKATKAQFVASVYNTLPTLSKVDAGEVGTNATEFYACPAWIRIVKDTVYDVKLWLSDIAFQYQYSEYETYACLPFTEINVLLGGYTAAKAAIDAMIIDDLSKDIDAKRKSKPETLLTLTNFSLHHPDAPVGSEPLHLPWAVLSYGEAGANADAVKLALRDAILNNSNGAHSLAEWTEALPDIFKFTEFAIVPRWDHVSIHGYSGTADIYNSDVTVSKMFKEVEGRMPYDAVHVASTLTVLPFQYASLMLYICPGLGNDDRATTLSELYPDYFFTGITSEDANRMSSYTVEWVRSLSAALQAAEDCGPDSDVPHGMHKVYRAGKVFVSFTYDRINYLVYGRYND